MVIVGSLPERRGIEVYNTAYAIDTDGSVAGKYRKVHLFSPTGEHQHFKPGRKTVVAQTSLAPIGLMICYDLRFPELCRSLTLRGALLVAIPAQWPAQRVAVWDVLLRARALENQIFIVATNRCGADGEILYGGHSRIISPDGEILSRVGKGPATALATVDFAATERVRAHIPCLRERMPEAYDL